MHAGCKKSFICRYIAYGNCLDKLLQSSEKAFNIVDDVESVLRIRDNFKIKSMVMHSNEFQEKLQQRQIGPRRRLIDVSKILLNLFEKSSYYNALIGFKNLEPIIDCKK